MSLWARRSVLWYTRSVSVMIRKAQCHCGSVSLLCSSEPVDVVQCHCRHCQRRTGSAFSLAAWFPLENVQISGPTTVHARRGDLEIETEFYFCPNCGTNLYWTSEAGMIGVAVGCFADPAFPQPTVVLYDSLRHSWISAIAGVTTCTTNEEGEPATPEALEG